jgi:cob(I)alamin adenosyltransferase
MTTARPGDRGLTSLPGGKKVSKTDPRIRALAALDELTCALGMARALLLRAKKHGIAREMALLQEDIIVLCGAVAGFPAETEIENRFLRLEASLAKLPPINKTKFIIPGDTVEEAATHCARAKCRTAETLICALRGVDAAKKYINRLSLFLFRIACD